MNKIILSLIVCSLVTNVVYAVDGVSHTGNEIFGDVGPISRLNVDGALSIGVNLSSTSSTTPFVLWDGRHGGMEYVYGIRQRNDWLYFQSYKPNDAGFWNDVRSAMIFDPLGNVYLPGNAQVTGKFGVGTSNPSANLDVNGSIKGSGVTIDSPNAQIKFYGESNSIKWNIGSHGGVGIDDFIVYDYILDNTIIRIDANSGDVGINTRLCINGDCRDSWPSASTSFWTSGTGSISYVGGNVGIGTNSPGVALDVGGTGSLRVQGGSAATTGAGVEVMYTGGTGYISAYDRTASSWKPLVLRGDDIILQEGGTEVMRIVNGNVGIGTNNPIDKLHVVGGVTIDDPDAQIEFYGESGRKWVVGSSGGPSDNFNIYDRDSSSVRLTVNASNGNIGIGTSTPTSKLDVVGDVKGTRLCIGSDCKDSWPDAGTSFWTSGTGGIAYVGGSVGIGTSTPTSRLDVVGDVKVSESLTAKSIHLNNVLYTNSIYSNPMGGQINFMDNVRVGNNKNLYVDGNVGIGTAVPSAKLDVVGKTSGIFDDCRITPPSPGTDVNCQSGEVVISGGGNCGSYPIRASYPSSTTRWSVMCMTGAPSSVYAICCPA